MSIDRRAPRASRIALAVSTCCFLLAGTAVAAPFGAFDARSAGMGHVGVAAGTLSNATFYNPALLAVQRADDDVAVITTAGARAADADDLIDDVDAFQAAYNSMDPTAAQTVLNRAMGKAVFAQGDGGLALALGGDRNAGALSVLSHVGAAITVTDPTPGTSPEDSELHFAGVEIHEIGLSLAHRFDIADGMAIGLTPKYMRVSTYDYAEPLVTASTDPADLIDSRNQVESDTVNLDAGIVFGHANGWRAGLVARNLIEKEFAMANGGGTIKLEPQARAGVAYVARWGTLAADLDLTENSAVSFEGKTQMAAVGLELNAFDLLQVRAGLQRNLSADAGEDQDTYSAGVGFSPFGVHVDVAAMTNSNENDLGVYAEVGLRF